MFSKLLKVSAALLVAVFCIAATGQQAQAQHYHYHGHQVNRGVYYGGSSCNSYRTYRPAVSVGFSTVPSVGYYRSSYPAYRYSRPVYARPVYYGNSFGGGFYGGSPRYYGNRGGISIGIRF